MPLAVNLTVLVFVAGGLISLSLYFGSRPVTSPMSSGSIVASAEGSLLREAQRDAASKLKEKDLAIADVQKKMADIDRQRQDLAANVDARVAEREKALSAALSAELEKEKARLKAQGLSEEASTARLAELKSKLEAGDAASLGDLRRQLEAERTAADTNLRQLQSEYESSIATLGTDRKKIQDEAQAREDALRAAMDKRTKELQSQGEAARSDLAAAKAELASLNARSETSKAAEDRIFGLYASIRDALRARRFGDAITQASSLRSYLAEPSVTDLPELQSRLPVDSFLAETLSQFASRELADASQDASRLLDQAELLASARQSALAADAARRAGHPAEADARYQEALEKVPELLAAHDWFMAKAAAEEASRRNHLDAALARASAAWAAGDRAAAVAAYRDALVYLPTDEAARIQILERVGAEAVARADTARLDAVKAQAADETKAALPLADEAQTAMRNSDWDRSFGAWLELATSYPESDQAPAALRGMKAALEGLKRDDAAAAAKAKTEIDGLRARAEESDKASSARIASLLKELDALGASSATAAAAAGSLPPQAADAAAASDLAELRRQVDALKAQVEALAGADTKLAGMNEAYRSFSEGFSAAGGDATGSLVQLKRFFADPRVVSSFADLPAALDLTLAAYSKGAEADRSGNAALLASTAFGMTDEKQRALYLENQQAIYAADPFMSAFIAALAKSGR